MLSAKKFKVWNPVKNEMITNLCAYGSVPSKDGIRYGFDDVNQFFMMYEKHIINPIQDFIFLQSIGKKDKNNKEIYEGDMFFIEIRSDDGKNEYSCNLIVTYIKEWTLFAGLSFDEYRRYELEGIDALNKAMFWTFPLKEISSIEITGNVYPMMAKFNEASTKNSK